MPDDHTVSENDIATPPLPPAAAEPSRTTIAEAVADYAQKRASFILAKEAYDASSGAMNELIGHQCELVLGVAKARLLASVQAS